MKVEDLTQVEAAEILGLSYRHTKRLYRRFYELGVDGLVHGNAGKPSNHSKPAKFRQRVLRLVTRHYGGDVGERFGPTLAAEHLAEDHGIVVDADTLRGWVEKYGVPRRSISHRRMSLDEGERTIRRRNSF